MQSTYLHPDLLTSACDVVILISIHVQKLLALRDYGQISITYSSVPNGHFQIMVKYPKRTLVLAHCERTLFLFLEKYYLSQIGNFIKTSRH